MKARTAPGHRRICVLVGLAALTLGAAPVWRAVRLAGAPRFTMTEIAAFSLDVFDNRLAINSAGQVAGCRKRSDGRYQLATWNAGKVTTIGAPRKERALSLAINDRGDVVGLFFDAHKELHGFLYGGGRMLPLTVPGGRRAYACDINECGQMVGKTKTTPFDSRPFLWENGRATILGTLGGRNAHAKAINERGQVVGTAETASGEEHAFFWQNGKIQDLGTLGGDFSAAADINERGQVVGSADGPRNAMYPFLWEVGKMTRIPRQGGATAINNRGWVVGISRTQPKPPLERLLPAGRATNSIRGFLASRMPALAEWPTEDCRAFLYAGGRTYDLNELIPSDTRWKLELAVDLNDRGQIVSWGTRGKEVRAFLLTPR